MATDPQYAAAARQMYEGWQQTAASAKGQKVIITGTDTVYEFPLVIHVMHNGEAIGTVNNPSDTQIVSWVNYTTAAYEATWPSYPSATSGGVRTHIRFMLAKTDPFCNVTTGIIRTNASSVSGYTANGVNYYPYNGSNMGVDEILLHRLSFWNPYEYINVYLVNKIDNPGIGGYATTPYTIDSFSSVTMKIAYATSGENTFPHELGHYLGLLHTFYGGSTTSCAPNNNCLTQGDYICDTEPDKQYTTCPTGVNPCTNVAYAGGQHNFMSYSACRDRFTAGQRDMMLYTIQKYWSALAASRAGNAPATTAMVPAQCSNISLNSQNNDSYGPLEVSFNDLDRRSPGFADENHKPYADNTCLYRTTVMAGHTYQLSIGVNAGTQQALRAYLDLNNDGIFQTPAEMIWSSTSTYPYGLYSTSVTIPTTGVVKDKPLRLRIIADDVSNTNISPCGALLYGQAEDYAVTVTSGTAVATPAVSQMPVAWPNPAGGVLRLSFPQPFAGDIVVCNSVGQTVAHLQAAGSRSVEVPTAMLAEGVYALHLRSASGEVSVLKIAVKH